MNPHVIKVEATLNTITLFKQMLYKLGIHSCRQSHTWINREINKHMLRRIARKQSRIGG